MRELEGALLRMGCHQRLNQSAETVVAWINSVTTDIGDTKLCLLAAMAAAQIEKGKLTELSSYSHYIAAGVGTL